MTLVPAGRPSASSFTSLLPICDMVLGVAGGFCEITDIHSAWPRAPSLLVFSGCSHRAVPCPLKALPSHLHLGEGWQVQGQLMAVFQPSGRGSPQLLVTSRGSWSQAPRFGDISNQEALSTPQMPCSPESREGSVDVRRKTETKQKFPACLVSQPPELVPSRVWGPQGEGCALGAPRAWPL